MMEVSLSLNRRPAQRGLSLVEILISLVLTVLIVGAVSRVYLSTKSGFFTVENMNWVNENARFALHRLGYDIRMAGYLGDLQDYWNLGETTSPPRQLRTVSGECFTTTPGGDEFRWVGPMLYEDGLTPANQAPKLLIENNASSNFSGCITTGTAVQEHRAGTDVVSSHYLDSNRATSGSALNEDDIYARVDMRDGVAFQCHTDGTGCIPPDGPGAGEIYPVIAVTYYVTSCGRTGDDGVCGTADDIPSLMRVRLWKGGVVSRERVADGVIDMQIQYGKDTDGDGLANAYLASDSSFRDPASWPMWATMKAVRVWLLLRVREPSYTDPTPSYDYGGVSTIPESGYRYELFTTTFAVRNQFSDGPAM